MHANVMNLHAFDFVFELILPQPHSPNTFSHRHASSNTHSHSHPPRTHFLTAPFPEHIFSQPPLADHTFVFMHDRMHAIITALIWWQPHTLETFFLKDTLPCFQDSPKAFQVLMVDRILMLISLVMSIESESCTPRYNASSFFFWLSCHPWNEHHILSLRESVPTMIVSSAYDISSKFALSGRWCHRCKWSLLCISLNNTLPEHIFSHTRILEHTLS